MPSPHPSEVLRRCCICAGPELLPTRMTWGETCCCGHTAQLLKGQLDSRPEHINSNSRINKDVLLAHKSLKCSQYHPHAAGEALDLGKTFDVEWNRKAEISALVCSDSSGTKKPPGEKGRSKGERKRQKSRNGREVASNNLFHGTKHSAAMRGCQLTTT